MILFQGLNYCLLDVIIVFNNELDCRFRISVIIVIGNCALPYARLHTFKHLKKLGSGLPPYFKIKISFDTDSGLSPQLEKYGRCLNYEFQNIANNHACVVYTVFFYTLHAGGKSCVCIWHSLNCEDVEKYTAVNSASSFQRPSLHVTVLNYMRNILTAKGAHEEWIYVWL